jgi:predicted KAP-like P-loop ATPase
MSSSSGPTRIDVPTLKGDAAKQSIAEDEFGLQSMVAGLVDALTKRLAADGYVLGIEGCWGSGKSTLANFLAEEIERTPRHYIVRFEPWLIGEKNALISFFFGDLASKVDEIENEGLCWWHFSGWRLRRLKSRLAKRIRQYGEYAGVLATPVGGLAASDPTGTLALSAVGLKTIGSITKLFSPAPLSLEKLKLEISLELKRLNVERPGIRFTVIIDDTDRLEPVEAAELLRLVRKVADFPFTTYVVCFDKDVLSMQVRHALQIEDGHHFIEKIFQDIIHVPPQEPFALRRNLRTKLEQSFPIEMSTLGIEDFDLQYRKDLIFDRWLGNL